MSNLNRIKAVNAVAEICGAEPMPAGPVDLGYYAEDVFNIDVMREYLSKSSCEKLLATITKGEPLDPDIAGDVETTVTAQCAAPSKSLRHSGQCQPPWRGWGNFGLCAQTV